MSIPKTIYNQLGANKFSVMTGSKSFAAINEGRGLAFQIGGGAINRARYVRITLEPDDTYTVEFLNSRMKKLESVDMVYADQLTEVFTRYTGFDTHL